MAQYGTLTCTHAKLALENEALKFGLYRFSEQEAPAQKLLYMYSFKQRYETVGKDFDRDPEDPESCQHGSSLGQREGSSSLSILEVLENCSKMLPA